MNALPKLTPEEQAAALQKAREARTARSGALNAMRGGGLTLAEALANRESPLQRAHVRTVLLALPGIGATRADAIMAELKIDSKRRIGGLGSRQREALVARVGGQMVSA
jgi:hypothetical protein